MGSAEKRKAKVEREIFPQGDSDNPSTEKRRRRDGVKSSINANAIAADGIQNPSASKRISGEGDCFGHISSVAMNESKPVSTGPKSKFRRKRVDCWGPERIEERRQELLQELEKKRSSLSVSRIKRIKARLADLAKAALGVKQVGGQLAKVSKQKSKGKVSRGSDDKTKSAGREFKRKRHEVNSGAVKRVKKICLRCRRRGHILQDCPLNKTSGSATDFGAAGMCFNCGKSDHTLKDCKKPRSKDGSLPFASCFVCNKVGHISSQCPESKTGKYPKGGSCRTCGSIYHLQTDCPEYQKQQQILKSKRLNSQRQGREKQICGGSQAAQKKMHSPTDEDADAYWSEKLNRHR